MNGPVTTLVKEPSGTSVSALNSSPDATSIRMLFAQVARRLALQDLLWTVSGALGLSAVAILVRTLQSGPQSVGAMLMVVVASVSVGVLATLAWRAVRPRALPRAIEQRVPSSKNLLITASELLNGPSRAPDAIGAVVLDRAARLARATDVSRQWPLQRPLLAAVGGATVLVLAALLSTRSAAATARARAAARALVAAAVGRIDITSIQARITPPAYTNLAASELVDPDRLSALVGSRIVVTVAAAADSLLVALRDSTRIVPRAPNGNFIVELDATADGFLAFEPRMNDGRTGARRLLGITARSDGAPRVRIVQPARDLIVPDAKQTLALSIEADDDLALASLRVRYTKVSGSGERFTFEEGELPVNVNRATQTAWTGRASLALEPLLVEPGDLVVYRAVAADKRPGAVPTESDAFIAELAAAGGLAALGFAMDPDEDRYAVSQQMVIQKTERLIAQQRTLNKADVAEQAAQLAAEQRRVRAEFVFMMGGEFAQQSVADENGLTELDEHEEAESEGDLAAGRMVNRGRSALLSAVRAMSRASVALVDADLPRALAHEKTALVELQEAFARARFLMRALSQREQLDLSRRLSGKREGVNRIPARITDVDQSDRVETLRDVLAALSTDGARDPARAPVILAERLLQLDASSADMQRIASQLNAANRAGPRERRLLLDSAAVAITRALRTTLRPAASGIPIGVRSLEAALDEARRTPRP